MVKRIHGYMYEKLKIHAKKTLPRKLDLAIDYTDIPYYGKEENDGDTIKTKPKNGTNRFYAYATIICNIKKQTIHISCKICSKRRNFKKYNRFLNKRNRSYWV